MIGYNTNPSASPPAGNVINCVMSLPGAKTNSVWLPIIVDAGILDKAKWYNVDPDDSELMDTTAGKFIIVLQSPVDNITANISFPVMLDYEIEFQGSTIDVATDQQILVWPAGTFNRVALTTTFTALAGEPAVPTLNADRPYLFQPAIPVRSSDVVSTAQFITRRNTTPSTYFLYNSKEDFNTDNFLVLDVTFTAPRSTIQLAPLN